MKLMKSAIVVLASVVAFCGFANAAPSLSWSELSEATRSGAFNPDWGLTYAGTSFTTDATTFSLGTLSASEAGVVTYTYLGREAAFHNIFFAPADTQVWQINEGGSPSIGDSVFMNTASGDLDFKFEGDTGNFAVNGDSWSTNSSIGLIAESASTAYGNFAFIIGYNDSATVDKDYDDMVIGVNIAAIPEPETYAMLLAGLGLMGFVARRRRKAQAA